jgi:hypothetical protein
MEKYFLFSAPVLLAIIAWVLPWKGVALWKAAKNNHKKWFIVILIFNTLALLEIIYIFYFAKKKEINPGL